MALAKARCPKCGNLNQHRVSSIGLVLQCKHCGHNYELVAAKRSCVSSLLGCAGLILLVCLIIVGLLVWNDRRSNVPPTQAPTTATKPANNPELSPTTEPEIAPEVTEPKDPENTSQLEQQESDYFSWTDSTGKFATEAKFVDYQNSKLTLLKKDGKQITVPIDRMSAESKQAVRDELKKRNIEPDF